MEETKIDNKQNAFPFFFLIRCNEKSIECNESNKSCTEHSSTSECNGKRGIINANNIEKTMKTEMERWRDGGEQAGKSGITQTALCSEVTIFVKVLNVSPTSANAAATRAL